jgi:hypothetical protein
MDYGEILTRAWSITWNNKFLWVLGFLVALTSGGSNGNSFQSTFDNSDFASNPELAAQIGAMAVGLTCVALIVGIIFWLVSIVARGGLIDGVNRIDDGEKVTLGEAFSAGTSAIWRLLGIYILAFLPLIIMGIVLGVVFAMTIGGAVAMDTMMQNPDEAASAIAGSFGLLGICMCLLICAIIPLALVLGQIAEFAARGTVIQKMGVMDSLSHGWNVLKENIGPVILLWLILFVIGLVVFFALGIVMLPLGLVIIAPMFTSAMDGGFPSAANIAWMGIGSICLGILGAALMSVIQTWSSAIWTLAYKEFTGKTPEPIPAEKVA